MIPSYQSNEIIDTGTMSIAPELNQQPLQTNEEKVFNPDNRSDLLIIGDQEHSIFQPSGIVDIGTMSVSPELMTQTIGEEKFNEDDKSFPALIENNDQFTYQQSGMIDSGTMSVSPELIAQHEQDYLKSSANTHNPLVLGSSPSGPTNKIKRLQIFLSRRKFHVEAM